MPRTTIEYLSDSYPERLRYIENPPTRLYVEGNADILNEIGISVIGSRTNTQYGERMCKKFVKKMSNTICSNHLTIYTEWSIPLL